MEGCPERSITREDAVVPNAKRAKLNTDSTSDDEQQETVGQDPGKAEYKEFSKALRALDDLLSNSGEDEQEEQEHVERLRETSGRLRQLCGEIVKDGEVPNSFKLLQIYLKHILMNSEKIREEDNVKSFLNGLEDGSACRSDENDSVFVFLAHYATELWYHWNEEEMQWYWSPDCEYHMPCSSNIVTGGQWKGEIPAPENVEIISYLDAIRPVPSDEQYIPLLKFDVLSILRGLCDCSDVMVRENGEKVVKIWKDAGMVCRNNKHVKFWKNELEKFTV